MSTDNNRKIKRKVRNAYVVSTVSIALVLFLLGAVGYLILGAFNATERLKENVTVHVMLEENLPEETLTGLRGKLSADRSVKELRHISKEAAAEEFRQYIGDDFESFLENNPLPASFEIKLKGEASAKDSVAALEKRILGWEGVDEVLYQKGVIEQIGSNINKFNLVLLLFGGTLLIISLILLNNTIRVTIFSKRYIINTMKLVGATRGFIMRPFLRNSILQGIYAGLIASAMLLMMIAGLREKLPEINLAADLQITVIFAAVIVGGILISFTFTGFAVRKFLRMNSSNIHLY